ncbi:MAG TPA: S41 family peptidase, partial [Candidatus Acidoferrales bacterium]|nr:S41 family peptidase [Candidatus Acidoferrales bacterium]
TRHALFAAVLCVLCSAAVIAKPIRIPRHPDYHDGKIIFSYFGSIWMVNDDGSNPRRLTVNAAHDDYPRFSPDGRWIAFSSNRYGNNDVFVMPAEGGEPKQLTFNSAQDTVIGWERDSKHIVFSTARGEPYPGVLRLYEVSIDGGLEMPLPTDWGYWGSYSPDGKKLVFNRHAAIWWRQHYRGSNAGDLWIYDSASKSYKKILDTEVPDEQKANNVWPQYGNGFIFFVSDREVTAKAGAKEVWNSKNNLWKVPENGGTPVQLTHFKDGTVFFPSISSDGKTIVFEEALGLWKMDAATGRASEVKIDIISDQKGNNFHVVTIANEADNYDLSPSSQRAAIAAHGEIFTIATDRGDITRVTASYSREEDPVWSPDGKWIAYVSDQDGRDEVCVAAPDGTGAKRLSDTDNEKSNLVWLPDSKSILFSASDHKLYIASIDAGQPQVLATNEASGISGVTVSPDGAWAAYMKSDRDLREHVWLVSTKGGQEHRLPDDEQFSSFQPHFAPDGKKLIFLGGFVQGGSATLRTNVAALYSVTLAKEDRDTMARDVDTEDEAREAAAERGGGRGNVANRAPVETKIDFDGMERRIHQVTRLSDNIQSTIVAPDSRSYAFVSATDVDGRPISTLYVIQADGSQLRRITQSTPANPDDTEAPPAAAGMGMGGITRLEYSRDGNNIYFMERNGIWAVRVAGGAGTGAGAAAGSAGAAAAANAGGEGGAGTAAGGRRRVNFTVRVEVDERAERKEVFEQAWRIMRDRFYDAKMNGVDWVHAREIYEPLLADVQDREELQNIILQMIGELNASHTGISGGGEPNRLAIQTRHPGFELAPDPAGYYKVTWIYKDGPADKDYVKLAVGNYVLAVNGEPLKSGDNYWRNFNLAAGRKFEFLVNSKPQADGAWTIKITPVNNMAYGTLQYHKWVEDRRATVEKMSNGEIGYLHIRQMNAESLAQFERDLADNRFKKALVIDQRFNPGGGIDQELLEILEQKQYQYNRGRDSVIVTRPQRAYFGPIVVMQNERSFSDAEVFPDGVRRLGLGKTVGTNTNGSVIGTGAFRLLDGSSVRTPGTGLWDVSGQNLENYGVPADVWVDNTPPDFFAGRDAQLEKAVQVLKDELAKNPPQKVASRE